MEPSTVRGKTLIIPRLGTNRPEDSFMTFVVGVKTRFLNSLSAKDSDIMLIPQQDYREH